MRNIPSNSSSRDVGSTSDASTSKASQVVSECSDDENLSSNSRGEGLECPICWESFNIVENVPYVLWCGHSLCKNCILGLQWAVVKFPTLPIQLPLFISCPWCNLLSFRLVYKGTLKFPRKNYFLLWMIESMNGDRAKSHSNGNDHDHDHHSAWSSHGSSAPSSQPGHSALRRGRFNHHHNERTGSNHEDASVNSYFGIESLHSSITKCFIFFLHLTSKFPLIFIFLLIILYAIPASAAILALYIVVTVVFAIPSFLILYFSYPSLDWLAREIIN